MGTILVALEGVKNTFLVGSTSFREGICKAVPRAIFELKGYWPDRRDALVEWKKFRDDAFRSWPNFSGNLLFPVALLNDKDGASYQFKQALEGSNDQHQKTVDYLLLRLELLDYLIEQAEEQGL